jgi:hypothetical protein
MDGKRLANMIDFLVEQWWFSVILLIILVFGDSYLTIVGARFYKTYAAQYTTYQHSYELNPRYENDVAQYRWFSRKQAISLLVLIACLSILRLLSGKFIFELFIGAALLQGLWINLRHLQNILIFRDTRRPGSISGHLEYSYWLSQRSSASNILGYAIVFSVAAFATMRPFFWGGVIICIVQSLRCYKLANRKFSQTPANIEPKLNE